ncbi:MAG TPA: DUF4352 domain-containing protein [Dehalococcoidia bacterium]|nr:DUF4352 domain-containing protein [Dehalococcoidia bacterium]
MKRILLVALLIMLAALTGCTSGLAHGDRTSDEAHAFLLDITQLTDQIESDTPPEGEVFLVIKYTVENLLNQQDSQRQWTDQLKLEADDETYEPTMLDSLADQIWTTELSAGETKTGYIVYSVPCGDGSDDESEGDIEDFKLTLTFPVSGNEEVYEFRPIDRRIGVNADYVLTRLEQIARTKRIPVIGGLLASLSSAPIRHLGIILVPEEEIDELLEQTKVLTEDAARVVVEEYLFTHGHGQLE